MIDGTMLMIAYLLVSALVTTVLVSACIVSGRHKDTVEHATREQRTRTAHSRRFTRAVVKTAHDH